MDRLRRGWCRSPAIATRSTSCARERVDHLVGVRDPVEVARRSSCARPARPGRRRRGRCRARRTDGRRGRRRSGRSAPEHRAQDRAAPRRQHRDPTSRWQSSRADPRRRGSLKSPRPRGQIVRMPRRFSGGRTCGGNGHGPEETVPRRDGHRRVWHRLAHRQLLPLVQRRPGAVRRLQPQRVAGARRVLGSAGDPDRHRVGGPRDRREARGRRATGATREASAGASSTWSEACSRSCSCSSS